MDAIHHAAERHHRPSPWDSPVAVISLLLHPLRATGEWLPKHPEAVILPALALLLANAGMTAVAGGLAGAGLAVIVWLVHVDHRAARIAKEKLAEVNQDKENGT